MTEGEEGAGNWMDCEGHEINYLHTLNQNVVLNSEGLSPGAFGEVGVLFAISLSRVTLVWPACNPPRSSFGMCPQISQVATVIVLLAATPSSGPRLAFPDRRVSIRRLSACRRVPGWWWFEGQS